MLVNLMPNKEMGPFYEYELVMLRWHHVRNLHSVFVCFGFFSFDKASDTELHFVSIKEENQFCVIKKGSFYSCCSTEPNLTDYGLQWTLSYWSISTLVCCYEWTKNRHLLIWASWAPVFNISPHLSLFLSLEWPCCLDNNRVMNPFLEWFYLFDNFVRTTDVAILKVISSQTMWQSFKFSFKKNTLQQVRCQIKERDLKISSYYYLTNVKP